MPTTEADTREAKAALIHKITADLEQMDTNQLMDIAIAVENMPDEIGHLVALSTTHGMSKQTFQMLMLFLSGAANDVLDSVMRKKPEISC